VDITSMLASLFGGGAQSPYPTQTPFSSELAGAPSPGQLTNNPTLMTGQPNMQAAAMQGLQQGAIQPSSAPSLSDLLGKLGSGMSSQGGSQGYSPPQAADPRQSSTAQLANYKAMDFSSKPILPPDVMRALMAIRGRM
jgi:hypothetical protein